jgi:purine-binding chemotaxis protein CheW
MVGSGIGDSFEAVMLALGGEVFALDAGIVREILDPVPVTDVPGADPFIRGVINVRGKVVPLADLRLRFGMEPTPPTKDTRMIVVEIDLDGDPTTVGILADKVYEVTEMTAASTEEAPRIGMQWRPEFVRCIGKRRSDFIIVPNIHRIFSGDGREIVANVN